MKKIVKVTTIGGLRYQLSLEISGDMIDIFVSSRYAMPGFEEAIAGILYGITQMLSKEKLLDYFQYRRNSPFKISEVHGNGCFDIFLLVEEVYNDKDNYVRTGLTFRSNSLHCSSNSKWNSNRENYFLPDLLLLMDYNCKDSGTSLVEFIKKVLKSPEELGIRSFELNDIPDDLWAPNGATQFSSDEIEQIDDLLSAKVLEAA